MKKSILRLTLSAAGLVLIVCFSAQVLSAQPPRARERIDQIKKTQLLSLFSLSEEEYDKLLVKYTYWEKQIFEKKENYDKAVDELRNAVEKQGKNIPQLTQKSLDAMNELHETMKNKMNDMKTILNENDFAKFVVWEHEFHDKLRKRIMKSEGFRRGGRPMPPPGFDD